MHLPVMATKGDAVMSHRSLETKDRRSTARVMHDQHVVNSHLYTSVKIIKIAEVSRDGSAKRYTYKDSMENNRQGASLHIFK